MGSLSGVGFQALPREDALGKHARVYIMYLLSSLRSFSKAWVSRISFRDRAWSLQARRTFSWSFQSDRVPAFPSFILWSRISLCQAEKYRFWHWSGNIWKTTTNQLLCFKYATSTALSSDFPTTLLWTNLLPVIRMERNKAQLFHAYRNDKYLSRHQKHPKLHDLN